MQLFSKIVEFFFKISEFGHLSQKTRSSRLDAGLYSSFWEEKENPITHQHLAIISWNSRCHNWLMADLNSQKPKFISRNYLMDSKSCENKLKVFVLKIHTYTLHIRFGISQQTLISFGINRCKFNSSTVQTTLKS